MSSFNFAIAILLCFFLSREALAECQNVFLRVRGTRTLDVAVTKRSISATNEARLYAKRFSDSHADRKSEKISEHLHLNRSNMQKLYEGESLSNKFITVKLEEKNLIITDTERGVVVLRILDFDRKALTGSLRGRMTLETKTESQQGEGDSATITSLSVIRSYAGTTQITSTIKFNKDQGEIIVSKVSTSSDEAHPKTVSAHLILDDETLPVIYGGGVVSSEFVELKQVGNNIVVTDTEQPEWEPIISFELGHNSYKRKKNKKRKRGW